MKVTSKCCGQSQIIKSVFKVPGFKAFEIMVLGMRGIQDEGAGTDGI